MVIDGLCGRMLRKYRSGFDFSRHIIYFINDDVVDMLNNYFYDVTFYHHNVPINFIPSAMWKK
jgi:hypothetical protein